MGFMVSTLDDQVVWVRAQPWTTSLNGASGKSQILRDFQGQIRGKNGRFCGNFAEIFEASFAENDW